MGEDEGREHFSLKGILKEEEKEAGGRKKRKRRRKGEEVEVGTDTGYQTSLPVGHNLSPS